MVELRAESEALSYKRAGLFSSQNYSVPYERINKDPIATRKIAWSWLIAIAVLGVAIAPAVVGLLNGSVSEREHDGAFGFAVMGAILIVIMAVQCVRQSHNLLIFLDERTGGNLFVLKASAPSRKEVQEFCEHIATQIGRIRYPSEMGSDQRISIYKKHLDFLLSEGVITGKEFSEISSRLSNRQPADVLHLIRSDSEAL